MKRFIVLFGIVTIVCSFVFAQSPLQKAAVKKEINGQEQGFYPIAGSHRLAKQWQIELQILKAAGVKRSTPSLKKRSGYGFTVGSQRSWYATDMSGATHSEYSVSSTCRAVGNNCYIFAEDANGGTRITQAAVDSVLSAFESKTPANTTKGIYQLDTTYFGTPPDVDGDPKIVILILDIKDGYTGTGGYVAGYYYSINQYSDAEVQRFLGSNRHSNEAEIYYVDCNPAMLTTSAGLNNVLGTTAHEFQHMIHWKYDEDEISFVNEGCSEVAEQLCGYGLRSPAGYYGNTNVDFLSWNATGDVLVDYSRTAIFTWYLVEQFGNQITKKIVATSETGEAAYTQALAAVGSSLQFKDVLKNFAVATKLNRRDYDTKYGFSSAISIKPSDHHTYVSPNVSQQTESLFPYATQYITYTSGTSLTIQFTSSATLAIRALAVGSSVTVEDVPLGQSYSVSGFGTTYSTVTFAVTNLTNTSVTYSFQSSGTGGSSTVELKYDETEPVGYLPLNAGDTVCVVFRGMENMRLDSIRVALRRTGSVTGGIWRYTGSVRPTPLGAPLCVPISASVSQTPSYPYPVPWSNWGTVDVRSYNIDASTSFAVAFVMQGEASTSPRVMVTESPYPTEPTSLTRTSENWYVLTANDAGDTVYTYLIRAYVSSQLSDVSEPIELRLEKIQLSQNYPNPFNPGTNFHYVLPSEDYIKLKVYDMLGREVATVFEGWSPKEQSIYWKPANLSAGTYFYRLETSHGIQTRKLLLIK